MKLLLPLNPHFILLVGILLTGEAFSETVASRRLAQRLYSHIAGVKLPLQDARISLMAGHLEANRLYEAAKRAVIVPAATPGGVELTNEDFINVNLFQFFAPKSVRSESPDTPMNDFIAMGIANTIADQPYTEMVEGDFTVSTLPSGRLTNTNLTISRPQRPSFPDAAGALTSQQFLSEHAINGTNRRIVQYAFRNFLCRDISQMRLSGAVAESLITKDVSRAPGGDAPKFMSECRTCHQVLDPLRKAFAFHDFDAATNRPVYSPGVVRAKINRVPAVMAGEPQPLGSVVADSNWMNFATGGSNQTYFQWDASIGVTGSGAKDFGRLIAHAGAFSRCAVDQVWELVCKKKANHIPPVLRDRLADRFVVDNHNLKKLFIEVAIQPECLGEPS
ncbi:hypothetical protein EBR78_02395 [bacterium]|nr:hypothetical protein [bacterium]NBX83504.1 hypothetical protein [bacterium]